MDTLLPILSGFDLVCHQPLLPLDCLFPQAVSSALHQSSVPFTTAPVHSPSSWETQRSPTPHSADAQAPSTGPSVYLGVPRGWQVGGLLGSLMEIPETVLLMLPSTFPFSPLHLCSVSFTF